MVLQEQKQQHNVFSRHSLMFSQHQALESFLLQLLLVIVPVIVP